MENVRIAILSADNEVCAFMDNQTPAALHYYDDKLHNYMEGTSNTFEFSSDAKHSDSEYLVVGNHLSFRYGTRDYYFNIVNVSRTEYEVTVIAYALVFELLNEQTGAYKSTKAMSFLEYVKVFNFANVFTVENNEVATKKINYEWIGSETILSRLFSLATVFDAELEFIPRLNKDYTLKQIVLNIYKEHDDNVQGVGTNRTDERLRYGVNVSGIEKKSDITELITAIRPIGRDNLTISSLDKKEYSEDGELEYISAKNNRNILAVQAARLFPSNSLANVSDRYIVKEWSYDTANVNVLYGQALAQLKKYCVPQVEYTVEGYVDAEIGDTFVVQDEEFTPVLYLSVRVYEQEISFTDPTVNKTKFSNFKELSSEIDPVLIKQVQKLIDENKVYKLDVISYRNTEDKLVLNARLLDGIKDITKDYPEDDYTWYKLSGSNLVEVGKGYTYLAGFEKEIYRCIFDDGGDAE